MKNPLLITDINLAAALAAVGIPLFEHEDDSPPFVKVRNAKSETFHFFFEPSDEASALVECWHDDSNPETHFGHIKAAFKNRSALLDVINQSASLVVMEKEGKFALISSNLDPRARKQLLARF